MAFARYRARSSEVRLNRRAEAHIGRIFTLERPIIDGRGRLKVDDTTWLVEGPDLPAGTRVQVTSVNNTLLRVSQL
jgi:membrane protein implicated in regulation of membrane protease activity